MTMKKKMLLTLIYFWFILIFLASCTTANLSQTQDVAVSASPITETTATVSQLVTTVMLTQSPNDVLPSPTKMAYSTQTPHPTVISTPDVEKIQQATREVAGQIVEGLMKPDVSCQLPCWWGVELGDSLENAEQKIHNLGIDSWEVSFSNFGDIGDRGHVRTGYYNNETLGYDISTTIDFYTVDGIVRFMSILVERPLPQYGKQEFARDWQAYDIGSILKQFGKPSYVYLIPQNVADLGPPNFVVVLYYPDLGFNFAYRHYDSSFDEMTSEFCLGLENMRQITLSLYDPEYVNTWSNYLVPPALNPEAESLFEQWTWEKQTGMDLDDFYQLYKDKEATKLECVQIIR